MKKLTRLPSGMVLPVILFLTVTLFFPSKVDAQTWEECGKTRARASYNCLTAWTKCFYPCTDKTKDVSGCKRTCDQSQEACNKQVDADYKVCLAAIPKEDTKVPTEANVQPKQQPKAQETKKESPTQTETETRFTNPPDPKEWPNPRDLIFDYLVKEAARFGVSAPGYWEIKPEDFVITAGASKPEGGNIWIVEPRTKAWVKAKGQNEYKPFDSNTRIELGSYIKTEVPVRFWVKDVGLVELRPGSSGNGMFTVEEINGEVSPSLLLGEMEIKYGKPKEEETQKPIDWEQIKFIVRTPNSSVTVSRTHYLVRYDEKEDETTVAVLEGEVEVKPNVGKPVKVTPQDGEPGVVVVSRKLSAIKLTIAGLILAAILGGVVLLLKKRGRKFLTLKKKTSK